MTLLVIFYCLAGRNFSPPPASSILSSRSPSKVTFKYTYLQLVFLLLLFSLDSRAILCLLTQAFVGKTVILVDLCSYSQLPWPLCLATLGWYSAILIQICCVLYKVHISFKDIFRLHNNPMCYPHFTDEVIEVHRGEISRIMLLLKDATGIETKTFDPKLSVLSNTSKLSLGSLFSHVIFAVQILHPTPTHTLFHLSPVAPFFKTFGPN